MTDESPPVPAVESVFEALADPDCRVLLDELDEPRTAAEVADRCDLPQTSTYRKLEALSEAALVAEQTEIRRDGHHATTYVRDFAGITVAYDDGDYDVAVLADEPATQDSPDQRLARLWAQIGDEL